MVLLTLVLVYALTVIFVLHYVHGGVEGKLKKCINNHMEETEDLEMDKGLYKTSVKFYVVSCLIVLSGIILVFYIGYETGILEAGVGLYAFLSIVVALNLAELILDNKEEATVKNGYVEIKKIWGSKKIDLRKVSTYRMRGLNLSFYEGDEEKLGEVVDSLYLKFGENHKLVVEIDREISKCKEEKVWDC